MPKGGKKGKGSSGHSSAPRKRSGRGRDAEEEFVEDDAASYAESACATVASLSSEEENDEGPELIDGTRGKISDLLEQTEHKNGKTRENGLNGLCQLFSKSYLPDHVDAMYETLLSTITRAVRRGTDTEKIVSCRLAAILMLQMGHSDSSAHYFDELKPILSDILSDSSRSQGLVATASTALATASFIAGALPDHEELAVTFKNTLRSARGRDQAAAGIMSSWALLLTDMPARLVLSNADSISKTFSDFLASPQPATRAAAGEALAVMYEMARESDEDYCGSDYDDIIESLKDLATARDHHQSKNVSKDERSHFRPIVSFLEENEQPEESMAITQRQSLDLGSWAEIKTLSFFKSIVGGGILQHMRENTFLRDFYQLADCTGKQGSMAALNKEQKKRAYSAMKMHRQVDRSACRGKRTSSYYM